MCQSMDNYGTISFSDEEIKAKTNELEELKFLYCKHMYDDVIPLKNGVTPTPQRVFEWIHKLQEEINKGGYYYYEDAELRCCGQG